LGCRIAIPGQRNRFILEEQEERSGDSCRDEKMNLTIDASVFVSAARPSEELYPLSFRFLQKVKGQKIYGWNKAGLLGARFGGTTAIRYYQSR